jgi:hypothetical protein
MVQSSRDLIDSINAEEERRYVESYRFMEEQKIKKALAPAQWEDLKDTLKEHCAAFKASSPVQMAMEEDGINDATVTNLRKGGSIRLRYDPDVPCVHVTVGGKSGHLGFRVSSDGTMVQFMEGQIPRDMATIVVNLMRRIR